MNPRATGVLGLLVMIVAACSSPEDAGAPAPTADERKAVAEAEAMIPAAERSAADETAPAAGKIATPEMTEEQKIQAEGDSAADTAAAAADAMDETATTVTREEGQQ